MKKALKIGPGPHHF